MWYYVYKHYLLIVWLISIYYISILLHWLCCKLFLRLSKRWQHIWNGYIHFPVHVLWPKVNNAKCRRPNTNTASDRQNCHDPIARRGHPCETPPAWKRRWTDGVRQRRPDTSAGGVGQEDETTKKVKKNKCMLDLERKRYSKDNRRYCERNPV